MYSLGHLQAGYVTVCNQANRHYPFKTKKNASFKTKKKNASCKTKKITSLKTKKKNHVGEF